MNCPYCNRNIDLKQQSNFCPECGHRFVRCAICGDIITKQVKFCPKDGTKIPEELLSELPKILPPGRESVHVQKKPYTPPPVPPIKSDSASSKYILYGVLVVGLAFALGLGSFFITNMTLNKKKTDVQIASELRRQDSLNSDTPESEEVTIDLDTPSEETNNTANEEPAQTKTEEKSTKKNPSKITASVSKAKKSSYSNLKKAKITYSDSSSVVTDNDPTIKNEAAQMIDGDQVTSWQEGVPGDGIGENVYFEFKKEYNVKYITFKMGNWRDQDRYNKNNRPRTVLLVLGGQEYELSFPDGMTEYMVKFSDGLPASDLYLEIRSVYKGYEWDDTCISEMTVYTE